MRSRLTKPVFAIAVVMLASTACGGGDSADPERFCAIDAELDELGDPLEFPPEEAQEIVEQGESLIDEFGEVAPDEVKGSAESLAGSFQEIIDVFKAADFDAAQIDQAELDAAFEAAFTEEAEIAVEEVDAWIEANCP